MNFFGAWKKYEYGLVAGAFLILWSITFQGAGFFDSYFSLIDDNIIVSLHFKLAQGGSFLTTLVDYIKEHLTIRFRPMWSFMLCVLTYCLELNHSAWVVFQVVITSLFSTLFFICLRQLTVPIILSAMIVLASMIGEQFTVFWRLANCDAFGLIFLSLSALLIIRNGKGFLLRPISIFTSTLLMSFCKESYVLVIPAILAAYLYSNMLKDGQTALVTIRKHLRMCVAMTALFFAEIIFIREAYPSTGVEISWDLFVNNLHLFYFETKLVALTTIALLAVYLVKSRNPNQTFNLRTQGLVYILLILVGLFIPQVILYSNAGFHGRYLFPAIFALSGLTAFLATQLFSRPIPKLVLALVLSLVFWNGIQKRQDHFRAAALAWSLMGKSVKELLDLAPQVPQDRNILIVADPGYNHEHFYALRDYLRERGQQHIYFYLIPKDHYENKMYDYSSLAQMNMQNVADVSLKQAGNPKKIAAIFVISINDEFKTEAKSWFDESRYIARYHPGAVRFHSYILKDMN